MTKPQFIDKSKEVHNNAYDYSNVVYINARNKVEIICKIHGSFWQNAHKHICGNGCPMCGKRKTLTTLEFVERSKKIHGDNYDYSKAIYKTAKDKIEIICKKHGSFWQLPGNHLRLQGCPHCISSKGEMKIRNFLISNNIPFIPQKTFDDCKGKRYKLPFDFYLPSYNICIEFNGKQHYKSIKHFGGDKKYKQRKKYDNIKKKYCIKNNIKLIEIRYNDYKNIESYIKNILIT